MHAFKQMQLFFAVLGFLISQTLFAADIALKQCEAKSCTFVLEGEIQKGDDSKFTDVRINSIVDGKLLNGTFLELNSDGGDLMEAIQLAKTIQALDVITTVRPENRCNSACVIILAAGASRIPAGKIGIHRPYNSGNLSQEEAKTMFENAKKEVLPIFETSGVSSRLWDLIVSTPPESLKFLTTAEKMELGLQGDSPAYGEYMDGVLAKHYGISKAELLIRKNKINQYCDDIDDSDGFRKCVESVYRTGTP